MSVLRGNCRICTHIQPNGRGSQQWRAPQLRTFLYQKPQTQDNLPLRRFFASKKTIGMPISKKKLIKPTTMPPVPKKPPRFGTHESKPGGEAPAPYTSTPYQDSITSTGQSTLLYLAPESPAYPVACLSVSGLLMAYVVYHGYDIFFIPHPGLASVVTYMRVGVIVLMGGIGVNVLARSRNLVRSIYAIPQTAKVGQGPRSTLHLWVERRRLLPVFGSQKVVDAPINEVERREDYMIERRATKPDTPKDPQTLKRERENEPFWKTLIKPIGRAFSGIPRAVRRIAYGEGFSKIYVEGKAYKLDLKEGWLLQEGGALDAMVKLRKD